MATHVVLLVVSGALVGGILFFGLGVEALRGYSRSRLRALLQGRPATAAAVERRLEREADLLSAALAWLTFVELALVAALDGLLHQVGWGPLWVRLAAAVMVSVLLVVLVRRGVAGALAFHRAERLLVALLPALSASAGVMRPLAAIERFVVKVVSRLLGEGESRSPQAFIQEEILSAVDQGERAGVFPGEQADMIESVLDLKDLDVRSVMTPRPDLTWLAASATLAEAARVMQESGRRRLPLYSGTLDNVVGVLYTTDLVGAFAAPEPQKRTVQEVAHRPVFVPATKPVWELLLEFRQGRFDTAVVVDEYGGTAGLVTSADIFEEVLGGLAQERERGGPPPFKRLSETAAEVDARVRVDELNQALHTALPKAEEYDSIGGLAFAVLGRVPAVGETFRVGSVDFTILEAGAHRVRRVRVEVRREEPAA